MIIYRPPNFKEEYETIKSIPQFCHLTQSGWIKLASTGRVQLLSDINSLHFDKDEALQYFSSLSQEKQDNYHKIRATSEIEMPIILTQDSHSNVIAGKTRLSGLLIEGWTPYVYVISLNKEDQL